MTHIHVLGGSGSLGLLFAAGLATRGARAGHAPNSSSVTLLLRDEALAAFRARAGPDGYGTITVQRPARREGEGSPPKEKEQGEEGGGSSTLTTRVRAEPSSSPFSDDADGRPLPKIDHLLIATKAPAVAPALRALAPRLHDRTVALLLCNGVLAVRDELLSAWRQPGGGASPPRAPPLGRLLVSSVLHGAFRPTGGPPFTVVHAGVGECMIGDLGGLGNDGGDGGGDCDAAAPPPELARALEAAGPLLSARWEPDRAAVRRAIATKLVANCAANAPAGLLRCRNGAMLPSFFDDDDDGGGDGHSGDGHGGDPSAQLHESVVRECVAALGLEGLGSTEGEDEAGAARRLREGVWALLKGTRRNVNSLLADVLAARGTEVEYLNGWVSRLALQKGLTAPVNETLARLVRMAERVRPEDRVGGGAS